MTIMLLKSRKLSLTPQPETLFLLTPACWCVILFSRGANLHYWSIVMPYTGTPGNTILSVIVFIRYLFFASLFISHEMRHDDDEDSLCICCSCWKESELMIRRVFFIPEWPYDPFLFIWVKFQIYAQTIFRLMHCVRIVRFFESLSLVISLSVMLLAVLKYRNNIKLSYGVSYDFANIFTSLTFMICLRTDRCFEDYICCISFVEWLYY